MKSIRMLAIAVVVLGLSTIAGATTFDLFVVNRGGNTVSFTLPASPTPTGTDAACVANLPPEFCISGVTATAPTFLLSTFDQTSLPDGGAITVTITQVVPEPSSLVLLGTGVLVLAAFLWRIVRKREASGSLRGGSRQTPPA